MRRHLRWLVPLAVLLGGLAFAFYPRPMRAIHSGDALLDWYAAETVKNLSNESKASQGCSLEAAESVEARFGEDPRYWLLRARVAGLEAILNPAKMRGQNTVEAELAVLREANAAGRLDANGILVYLIKDRDNLSPEVQQALMNKAIEAAPDEAWPYYFRGISRLNHNDPAAALADLQKGNLAEVRPFTTTFPTLEIDAALRHGEDYGNPALMGLLEFQAELNGISLTLFPINRVLHDKLDRKLFAEYPTLFDELLLMGCRVYESNPSRDGGQLADWLLSPTFQVFKEQHEDLDPKLADALLKAEGVELRISKHGSDAIKHSLNALSKALDAGQESLLYKIPGLNRKLRDKMHRSNMLAMHKDAQELQQYVSQVYPECFAALKQFRLSDPSTASALDAVIKSVPDPYHDDDLP